MKPSARILKKNFRVIGIGIIICFLVYANIGECRSKEASVVSFTNDRFQITISDNRLSLIADEADVTSILEVISRKTGITIRNHRSHSVKVSDSFRNLSLKDAIRRLVGNTGMVYLKNDKQDGYALSEVFVAERSLNKAGVAANFPISRDPLAVDPEKSLKDLTVPSLNVSPSETRFADVVPGEIIISFEENADPSEIDRTIAAVEGTVKKQIKPLNGYVISLPDHVPMAEAFERIEGTGSILHAEPNIISHLQTMPNDPLFSFQWGLSNTGRIGGSPFHDIDARNAWNIELGNPQAVIAVVDTGIDYLHPDLSGNIWRNPHEIPGNGIDDDGNGYIDDTMGWDFVDSRIPVTGEDTAAPDNDPMDRHGHGTLVAGVIGASGNNRMGVTGVSWHGRLMPVRAGFKLPTGEGIIPSDAAAEAILYAAQNGAHVINLSWSSAQQSRLIENAIAFATDMGVLVCAAAGNQNTNYPQFPAAIENPGILTVGASDFNDQRAPFSNFGNWVEVFAPGVTIYSTYLSKWYAISGGTSLAVAFVSGTAGLIKSENPHLNHLQIKDTILNTVDMVPGLAGLAVSSGRINAGKALKAVRIVTVGMKPPESSR